MLHAGITNYVLQDLEQISVAFAEYGAADQADLPGTLSYVTNAAGIHDMVANRSLKAAHSGFGVTAADIGYGIGLIESFLAARLLAETDPVRHDFCREVIANLNPRGTWFESFLIRFFEDARTARIAGDACSGYALVLRTAGMSISGNGSAGRLRLAKAIYSRDEQLKRVATMYSACEDCYVNAVQLFGEEKQVNFLAACWDRFRQVAGEMAMLFRNPSLAAEKEWVATTLRDECERGNDNVEFELRDNALVPHVRVGMPIRHGAGAPGMAIDCVVIGRAVQSPSAEEGVRAFLRKNRLFQVVVRRA